MLRVSPQSSTDGDDSPARPPPTTPGGTALPLIIENSQVIISQSPLPGASPLDPPEPDLFATPASTMDTRIAQVEAQADLKVAEVEA